jgi:hypothetical protein
MGFKQSSVLSNDLFGAVISGCLAGFGIWTKPSPAVKTIKTSKAAALNLSASSTSLATSAENTVSAPVDKHIDKPLDRLFDKSRDAVSNVYPLRVIRVLDKQPAVASKHMPKMAGRMVISGRMADVCAELDRLAA